MIHIALARLCDSSSCWMDEDLKLEPLVWLLEGCSLLQRAGCQAKQEELASWQSSESDNWLPTRVVFSFSEKPEEMYGVNCAS